LVKPPENQTSIDLRKGMPPRKLDRASFQERFLSAFIDPSFDQLRRELKAVSDAAWDAYSNGRKSPLTRKAGPGFADPDYDLAADWLAARDAIRQAEAHRDRGAARILLVNGSSRTEHTCPGEMSKTWRLVEIAKGAIETGFPQTDIDVLDLSRTTSEFGKTGARWLAVPPSSGRSTVLGGCSWRHAGSGDAAARDDGLGERHAPDISWFQG
jgi:hypothetical protein